MRLSETVTMPRTSVWQAHRFNIVDILRWRRPHVSIDLPADSDDDDSGSIDPPSRELPAELAAELCEQEHKQRERLVEMAKNTLSKPLWDAVSAVYFQGKSCSEAAEELGVSLDTLHQRLSRARRQIGGDDFAALFDL